MHLVAAGGGYIGSIVAQQLLAHGDDVTVLDSRYRNA
jgi:nucleoside-diphosphate-sugar epimerase